MAQFYARTTFMFLAFIANIAAMSQAKAESGSVGTYVIDTGFRQIVDKTTLRNTCGAMCALIVYNHFDRGVNDFTDSPTKLVDAVRRIYTHEGMTISSYFSTDNIKHVMTSRWMWNASNCRIRSTYSGYSYSGMIADLNSGRPVVTLMKGWSVFEPADAQGRKIGADHFIVVFEADDSRVVYQDPWDGQRKTTTKAAFTGAWTATRVSVVGKP